MRTRTRSLASMALGLIAALAFAGVTLAAESTVTATLAPVAEGENPGNPDGSGSASIVVDPTAGTLCWELTVDGIGPVLQSHIHVGAEGASGDVVVPLDVDGFDGTSEGCIEPMEDAAVLQEIIDDPAGYYVNVHTEDFPAGAIRGQLAAGDDSPDTAMPMSDSSTTLLGALLLALAATIGLRAWRPFVVRD
ncbi:MAG: CHRD domain-containing protein [Candidatus Limnocylindria bacterium]